MSKLNAKQQIKLAVVLQDSFNTGDWQELFVSTDTGNFLNMNPRFLQDVDWQNDGLKHGCIRAVEHILEKDSENLREIWGIAKLQSLLKRKEPELHDVIEALVQGAAVVVNPEIKNVNETVLKALEDAETLLSTKGAASAYDRSHTALHGFLRQVCANKNILYLDSDAITALLPKVISYIKEQPDIGRNEKVSNMLRTVSSLLHTLNELRNHHSLSHANQELLTEADAQFSINLTRSIMSYIDELVG